MSQEKTKVYIYTRVSTAMQIKGIPCIKDLQIEVQQKCRQRIL